MQRFTISLEDELAERFDAWARAHHYENRSEAIRDLLRDRLGAEEMETRRSTQCAAAVTYVYDHHERNLGQRLIEHQHDHHGLTIATLHAHLDESLCLEVAVLRGSHEAVSHHAQSLVAERGVRHGQVHLVPLPGAGEGVFRPANRHPATALAPRGK